MSIYYLCERSLQLCHRALGAICKHLGIKVLTREEIEAEARAEFDRNVKSTMEKLKDFLKEHGQSIRIDVKNHFAVQLEDVLHVSFRCEPPGYFRHSDNKEILFTGDYTLTVEKRNNDREAVVIEDRFGKRIVCDTLYWIARAYWGGGIEIALFEAPTRQTIVEQHTSPKEAT